MSGIIHYVSQNKNSNHQIFSVQTKFGKFGVYADASGSSAGLFSLASSVAMGSYIIL